MLKNIYDLIKFAKKLFSDQKNSCTAEAMRTKIFQLSYTYSAASKIYASKKFSFINRKVLFYLFILLPGMCLFQS